MNHFPLKRSLLLSVMAIFFVNPCMGASTNNSAQEKLAALEASFGGRVGIYALNTANNEQIQYRAAERFPVQSTFKLIGVAAILKQSMKDSGLLQQKMTYTKQDLVFWSPITEKHLAVGMTIAELSGAAMSYSDNTATNILVKKLGGPEAVNNFAHSIGNETFRIDGWEPNLNSNPADIHDTSTPAAMGKSLQQLALGNVLTSPLREQLVDWLKGNTTGDKRIRAGVPKTWVVGEKTGSGDYGIVNDIAIIWPPKCAPLVVAIYTNQNKKDATRRDDVLVSATRILMDAFAQTDQCIQKTS